MKLPFLVGILLFAVGNFSVFASEFKCPIKCLCSKNSPLNELSKKCGGNSAPRCGKRKNGIPFLSACAKCTKCEKHQKVSVKCGNELLVQCLEECEKGYYWDAIRFKCQRCSKCPRERGGFPIPIEPECSKMKPHRKKTCSETKQRRYRKKNRKSILESESVPIEASTKTVLKNHDNLAVNSSRDEVVHTLAKFILAVMTILIIVLMAVAIFQAVVIFKARKLLFLNTQFFHAIPYDK